MAKLYGAALEFLARRFGGSIAPGEDDIAVGIAQVEVIAGDSERVSLVLVNLGGTVIYVAPGVGVSSTRGIRLGPSGGTVAMDVNNDSILPSVQWYAIGDAAGGSLYVLWAKRAHIIKAEGEE